jgi:tRNA 5-methylaminomethyl-2-thiouridine biosynthesis bifunctional protein
MQVVDWDEQGQPRSTLYPDVYRSRSMGLDQGLAQARHVFLDGCGLRGERAVWRHQSLWCVLENGFGLGLNFLATWQAWRDDPHRPARLHYVATESHPVRAEDLLRSALPWPELKDLSEALARSWWGWLPGVHRLAFEQGAVVLDLVVGESACALAQLDFKADSVYLDGFSPRVNPGMWQTPVLRECTRLSRPGALWASWCVAGEVTRTLTELGLKIAKRPGLPPKRECLQARWPEGPSEHESHPVPDGQNPVWVLGAGLAGASTARALAERGVPVKVLDARGPAAGASGLPAGLSAVHTSGDDIPLSRLTRMGLRHTLARLQHLQAGVDWMPSGLDELKLGPRAGRQPPEDSALCRGWWPTPTDLAAWRQDWWQTMPGGWHQPHAAWFKPARLVRHLLDHPAIEIVNTATISNLARHGAGWQITDQTSRRTQGIQHLVIALGPASGPLLAPLGIHPPMQAVRGQVTMGQVPSALPQDWPDRPRNGDGSLLPCVPWQGQQTWMAGASFDRQHQEPDLLEADQALNGQRWLTLAPECAAHLSPQSQWSAWAGVRATVRDRLPWVGPLAHPEGPGLWLLAGLGARGLTLATLCGEHLAAQMTQTPDTLPLVLRRAWSTTR